jgi:drug/metabolite transporter (DMT)-like permease
MKTPYPTRALLALAATLLLWSSAYAGIRAGLRGYSPSQLALLRFLIASLALAAYAATVHFRRLALRDVPGILLAGAVGITFYNIALNYGEIRVTAGAASLLIASTPIWTAILATILLHERLTALGWVGVFISFAGVALIATGEEGGVHLSRQAFVILAAALASASYMILQKHFLERYSALEFTAYSIWLGTLLMIPFGRGLLTALHRATTSSTVSVIYLGVFPAAFAYVAWAYVMSHGSAGGTTSSLYLTPVLAIGIAWVWLGEVPRMLSLIGGIIALAGVVMVNFWGHPTAGNMPDRASLQTISK